MNASKLRAVVEELIEDDKRRKVSELLAELASDINNLVGSPQAPTYQTAFSDRLHKLLSATIKMETEFYSGTREVLREINAERWFTSQFVQEIKSSVIENALTPAVLQSKITKYNGDRTDFIAALNSVNSGLDTLSVQSQHLAEGEAQVGFTLPRSLFENSLDGLANEITVIKHIVRPFQELTTGSCGPIELKTLSTSNPEIVIAIPQITTAVFGAAVLWSLDLLKRINNIRKVSAEVQNLNIKSAVEAAGLLNADISEEIKTAIKQKVADLVGAKTVGRPEELRGLLRRALELLIQRLERGVTVQVAALSPPDDNAMTAEEKSAYREIDETNPKLIYTQPTSSPVLELTYVAAESLPIAEKRGVGESGVSSDAAFSRVVAKTAPSRRKATGGSPA